MRRGLCLAGVVAMCLASGAPRASAADAASFFFFSGGGGTSGGSFKLRSSNGYSINVSGSGKSVTAAVFGAGGYALYQVKGWASGRRIVATLGSLGKIDVRFRQTTGYRLHKPPARCEGKAHVTRFGVFTGSILFHGEHGYTTVDADHAQGDSHFFPPWKCKKRHHHGKFAPKHESGGADGSKPTVLEAERGDHRISFSASTETFLGPAGTLFSAQMVERRRRMLVLRSTFAAGGAGDFEFDEGLTSATVRPPGPFSGSATFAHGAGDSTSWTGDLRVTLPGAPHLALTGKRFEVSLQQAPFLRPQPLSFRCAFSLLCAGKAHRRS